MDSRVSGRRNILAGTTGTILEWYDFAVYGTLTPILGKQFFPTNGAVASLLVAFTVFAVGFVVRPLGGILLGHIGDRMGHKPALMLSVLVMGLATTAMGLLPTHAQIGTAAAVLLVLMRIVQGLSIGGEYPESIVFLAEHAPAGRRGYFASWPMFGSVVGFLLGSAVVAALGNVLGEAAMQQWGWRIPLLAGSVLTIFGLYVRHTLVEPAAFGLTRPSLTAPAVSALRDHWRALLRIVGLSLVNAVGFYLLAVYAASYLTERMHVSTANALDMNILSLVVMLPAVTMAAVLSDRIGRKPILFFTAAGTLVLAWPPWWLMHHQNFALILAGQAGLRCSTAPDMSAFPPLWPRCCRPACAAPPHPSATICAWRCSAA